MNPSPLDAALAELHRVADSLQAWPPMVQAIALDRVGLYVVDVAGVVTLSTGGALSRLGLTDADVVGTHIADWPGDGAEGHHRAMAGESWARVTQGQGLSEGRWFFVQSGPHQTGGTITIYTDLTGLTESLCAPH